MVTALVVLVIYPAEPSPHPRTAILWIKKAPLLMLWVFTQARRGADVMERNLLEIDPDAYTSKEAQWSRFTGVGNITIGVDRIYRTFATIIFHIFHCVHIACIQINMEKPIVEFKTYLRRNNQPSIIDGTTAHIC